MGVSQDVLGGGDEKIIARNSPDMLGEKNDMKRVPMRALNTPTSSKCTAFQGEATRDDGRSPTPYFGSERPVSALKRPNPKHGL